MFRFELIQNERPDTNDTNENYKVQARILDHIAFFQNEIIRSSKTETVPNKLEFYFTLNKTESVWDAMLKLMKDVNFGEEFKLTVFNTKNKRVFRYPF